MSRTPILDERIELAKREFGNPAFVDAIVRSFAALKPSEVYSIRDIRRIALPYEGEQGLDISSMASIASGLLAQYDRTDRLDEASRKRLDVRLAAFLDPFDAIVQRWDEAHENGTDPLDTARHQGSRRRSRTSSRSYGAIASVLGLSPTPITCLLLRFGLLPAGEFAQCVKRMGFPFELPEGVEDGEWMLSAFLSYYGMHCDRELDERVEHACEGLLRPLTLVGRVAGLLPDDPTVPTLTRS